MMVRYVLHVHKGIRVVKSDFSCVVRGFNTEGSEMCFNCINCNVKLIQHRLIKFFCLKRCRINYAEMNERMSKLRF